MFTDKRQGELFKRVAEYFRENKSDQLHDIDHVIRVVFWARLLSEEEKADLSVTIPAAILHDIGMPRHGDELHARKGAEMSRPLLKACGYQDNEIERIAEAILVHSTDDPSTPETTEGRVLFDADKLDATGPVGLHRWFFEYSKKGFLHHEALRKILEHIQAWKKRYGDPPFFTRAGRRTGGPRLEYVEERCNEILRDLERFREVYALL